MACFAVSGLSARETTKYYYGALAYADLALRLHEISTFWDGVRSVTKHDFVHYEVCQKIAVEKTFVQMNLV